MTTTGREFRTALQTASTLEVALDPIRDTQAIFRAALDALSWPGSIRQLPAGARGAPVNPWAAGLLITLLDHEVTLAVDSFADCDVLARFIRQRANVASATPSEADFVLAHTATIDPKLLLRLKRGSLEYPDDGATLVVLIDNFAQTTTTAQRLLLDGPGVPARLELRVSGLVPDVIRARNEAVGGYPCGIDLLLIDRGGQLAALPRSTHIELATEEDA